jgi:outer membrane protein insertion porin family
MVANCSSGLNFDRKDGLTMKSRRTLHIGTSLVYLAVLCLVFIVPGPSCSENTPLLTERVSQSFISRIVIDIHDFPHDAVKLKEMARNLIFLNEGEAFSDARLRDSINALKLSKKFREIHVDSTDEEAGTVALFFRLIPFRQIKDIRIDGQYPLFEREVLNTMTMYIGDAFIQEDLPQQADLITTLYKRYGFTEPKVEVRATENAKDGTIVIHVTITKDTYYSFENLEIT